MHWEYKEKYIRFLKWFLSLYSMWIESDSEFAFGSELQILINQKGNRKSSENSTVGGAVAARKSSRRLLFSNI